MLSYATNDDERFAYHQKSPVHQTASHCGTSLHRYLWCNLGSKTDVLDCMRKMCLEKRTPSNLLPGIMRRSQEQVWLLG